LIFVIIPQTPPTQKALRKIMRANGPGQSSLLLLDVVDILNKSHISYAVIGALAASFYGTIRASMDADVLIFLKKAEKGTQNLLNELVRAGFLATQRQGDADDPVVGVINIQDNYNNRVDLLLGIRRMPEDIFSRTINSPFLGSQIRIVGLEDFVAMKIFAGGPQDTEDVKNVLEVSAEKINVTLLRKLTLNYGKVELKKLETLMKGV